MSDSKISKDYRDRKRINLKESYEVAYWTRRWNITVSELTAAVKASGTSVKEVESFLDRNKKL